MGIKKIIVETFFVFKDFGCAKLTTFKKNIAKITKATLSKRALPKSAITRMVNKYMNLVY